MLFAANNDRKQYNWYCLITKHSEGGLEDTVVVWFQLSVHKKSLMYPTSPHFPEKGIALCDDGESKKDFLVMAFLDGLKMKASHFLL